MPKNELIERFHKSLQNHPEYSNLSFEEVNEICLSSYSYFRKRMQDDDIPDIRIKHLGSFQIFPTPVINQIQRFENRNELSDYHKEKQKILKDYVQNNLELFKKNDKKRNTNN